MDLKLEAKTRNEELVLNYLKETATEILAEKINNGKKTLQGCWNYITTEAQKKAVQGCACIESQEVFSWATHYFYEDSISECKTAPAVAKVKAKEDKKEKPKDDTPAVIPSPAPKHKSKDPVGQISMFDMFAGE